MKRAFCLSPAIALFALLLAGGSIATADEERHPVAEAAAAKLGVENAPFTMIVEFVTDLDQEEAFITAMKKPLAMTVKESGNRAYQLSRHPSDASRFVLYESWVNVAALDSHLKEPYLIELGEAFGDLLREKPVINYYLLLPTE